MKNSDLIYQILLSGAIQHEWMENDVRDVISIIKNQLGELERDVLLAELAGYTAEDLGMTEESFDEAKYEAIKKVRELLDD
jgi:hypothetical protein